MDDPLEAEHWQIVLNHPAFLNDLEKIKEEIDEVYPGAVTSDLMDSALENPNVDWPAVRAFSDKWGLPPSALIGFAAIPPSKLKLLRAEAIDEFRQEAHGLIVIESDAEFIVRIPRPLTSAKKSALKDWIKLAPTVGPREVAWGRDQKKREDLSPTLVESIPWFHRWNSNHEEPVAIWRDLTKAGGEFPASKLHDHNVYDRILAVWERMKILSPDGIRSDKPSKKRA